MSQENLQKALEVLEQLEALLPADGKSLATELKNVLHNAQRYGEGQSAEEAQQRLTQTISENGQFVSVMVHEVRKPMTAMRGWVDMLSKEMLGPLNPMQSEAAKTIRNNVLSMESLVTDISDISKMRTGRLQLSPKMDMVKNILMQVEKDVMPEAEARHAKLTFEIPSGLPFLNLDGTRVQLALRKLIDNALKYTKEGEAVITVTAEGRDGQVVLKVIDNGIGVPEEDQKRLGELFFRGDSEHVLQTKGYGLGIPIAQVCMQLIGGKLFWESKVGAGSTFGLILPGMS
jgi:signal transduction histidine kinase